MDDRWVPYIQYIPIKNEYGQMVESLPVWEPNEQSLSFINQKDKGGVEEYSEWTKTSKREALITSNKEHWDIYWAAIQTLFPNVNIPIFFQNPLNYFYLDQKMSVRTYKKFSYQVLQPGRYTLLSEDRFVHFLNALEINISQSDAIILLTALKEYLQKIEFTEFIALHYETFRKLKKCENGCQSLYYQLMEAEKQLSEKEKQRQESDDRQIKLVSSFSTIQDNLITLRKLYDEKRYMGDFQEAVGLGLKLEYQRIQHQEIIQKIKDALRESNTAWDNYNEVKTKRDQLQSGNQKVLAVHNGYAQLYALISMAFVPYGIYRTENGFLLVRNDFSSQPWQQYRSSVDYLLICEDLFQTKFRGIRFPIKLVRRCLSALVKEQHYAPPLPPYIRRSEEDCNATPAPHLFFRTNSGIYEAVYSPKSDKCVVSSYIYRYYETKSTHAEANRQKLPVISSSLTTFLSQLCGGSTWTLDQLAVAYYHIMNPAPKDSRVSVICSEKNAGTIQQLFERVFSDEIVDFPYKGKENSLFSITRLTSKRNLMLLEKAQYCGKALALLNEKAVSKAKMSKTRQLVKGHPIKLGDQLFPALKLQNTIHIVCISNNLMKGKKLAKSLSAHFLNLDFGKLDVVPLNRWQLAWMRLVFLCHGLKVATQAASKSIPPERDVQAVAERHVSGPVEVFWERCCAVKAGSYCSGTELHQAYCKYCELLRLDNDHLEQMTLGKRIRSLIEQSAFPVEYRKKRFGADQNPRYYYLGLEIRVPSDLQPEPEEKQLPAIFEEYLKNMNHLVDELPVDRMMDVSIHR